MTMSIAPCCQCLQNVCRCSALVLNRDSDASVTGNSAIRSRETAEMLLGEHRRRHEHRDLLAGVDRFERNDVLLGRFVSAPTAPRATSEQPSDQVSEETARRAAPSSLFHPPPQVAARQIRPR